MRRALVVDDSHAMRSIIRGFMRDLGYHVEEASDGREALDLLTTDARFDVALVDWNMPIMDGLALVSELRANPRLASLHLVMITTENEQGQVHRALEAGVDEYIMKPFSEADLREKLALLDDNL